MIRVLLLTIVFYSFQNSQELGSTGIYVMISDKDKNCPQKFMTIDSKQAYCVPKRPILDRSVFISVSEIKQLEKRKYIDLYISVKGMESLKNLVTNLPNASFILVVEDKVVGVLKNKDVVGRFIRIDSDIFSKDIDWVHDRLKKSNL